MVLLAGGSKFDAAPQAANVSIQSPNHTVGRSGLSTTDERLLFTYSYPRPRSGPGQLTLLRVTPLLSRTAVVATSCPSEP